MKKLLLILCVALIASCGSGDEEIVEEAVIDSLVKPNTPVATGDAIELDSTSGLMLDKSRVRSPDHISTMERFEPTQVVSIYTAFRPLRKEGLSKVSLDSFLAFHKVSEKELRAILYEGDQLGWQNAEHLDGRPKK